MSAHIGSVFLGDVQRRRILSPTPPSSPDPVQAKKFLPAKQPPTSQKPPTITPELSLELRLRWLEALLHGAKPKDKPLEKGETLLRSAQQIQKRLDGLVQNNDSLRKFMDQCACPFTSPYPRCIRPYSTRTDDQYSHLLTLSGIIPNGMPSYESMTPSELETFLQEMEPDIRAADRDMREIEALDQKGVATVGKLTSACPYSPLVSQLFTPSMAQITKHSDPASKHCSKPISETSSSLPLWKSGSHLSSSSMEHT